MDKKKSSQKILVSPDNKAQVVCPDCDYSSNLPVLKFRNRKHLLKIKCKCGHFFKVQLEFRRYFRKETDLYGICELDGAGPEGWNVSINNVSLGGARLEFQGSHHFKIGEEGILRFSLDDRKHTFLNRPIVIRSVASNHITCQFFGESEFEKDLGFYLRH